MKKALVMLLTIALMLSSLIIPAAQAEEPETLKILRFYSYIDLAADNALGLTEEATGYNLEFDTLPIEMRFIGDDDLHTLASSETFILPEV